MIPMDDIELVKVFEATNPAVLPLVESMLRDAEIEFMTKGAVLQDLFGIGRFGTGRQRRDRSAGDLGEERG